MDAKTYPLQDILKPERRYIIPTFQRDYEWTLEGQWRLLFEDLGQRPTDSLTCEQAAQRVRSSSRRSKEFHRTSWVLLSAPACLLRQEGWRSGR